MAYRVATGREAGASWREDGRGEKRARHSTEARQRLDGCWSCLGGTLPPVHEAREGQQTYGPSGANAAAREWQARVLEQPAHVARREEVSVEDLGEKEEAQRVGPTQ